MVGLKRKTRFVKVQREGRFGRFHSRSKKMVYVKTPGGRTTIHYKGEKFSKVICASCGAVLAGTLNAKASDMRKIQKTGKRPERPYGGNLCSYCMRRKLIGEARK